MNLIEILRAPLPPAIVIIAFTILFSATIKKIIMPALNDEKNKEEKNNELESH